MQAMSVCETLELSLNDMHEEACALYIRHQNNPAIVDYFLEGEFFGADRAVTMKDRMRNSVKEIPKLS